jgi:hypothetical protein
MSLFRRRKPLHVQLAEEGGLLEQPAPAGLPAEPPGWDGAPRGEPGIHGVPRSRRWDAVVTADLPAAAGHGGEDTGGENTGVEDTIEFVALPDGTLLSESRASDDALGRLAAAVEEQVPAPYRAEAVRREAGRWAVGARRIQVAELRRLDGDEAELTAVGGVRTLHVDGRPSFGSAPELERVGEAEGREYVVRARRLDGHVWEVEATPL